MTFTIRAATAADTRELVALRRVMFEGMGHTDVDALDRMCAASERYFAEHLPTGAFRAWVAEVGGRSVGSIGLVIHSVPPSPRRLESREAYIMNLVTLPGFRGRGIASALLERVLETARLEGVPIASLHATAAGRGIYERAGFRIGEALPEMKRSLAPDPTP